MAQGSKKAYTSKQKRRAKHIEDSAKESGKSSKTAARVVLDRRDVSGAPRVSDPERTRSPNRP